MQNLFKKKFKIITKNPYDNSSLNYNGIIIKGEWKESYFELITKKNIKALFLNCSLGWSEDNYDFFEKLPPTIEEIDILDDYIKNLRGLEIQKKLTRLKLDAIIQSEINFKKLTSLNELYIHAENLVEESLYDVIHLEKLHIDEFKQKDNHQLGNLVNLNKLTIGNSNITSLEFLKKLDKLETLELYNCKKVLNFSAIKHLKNLKRLDISGYKNIGDISFVSNLKDLEVLLIDAGIVDSIKPLSNLFNLKALSIYGKNSKIKDCDLDPIRQLKNLSILDIVNKKDYNNKIKNYWNWDSYGNIKNDWLES